MSLSVGAPVSVPTGSQSEVDPSQSSSLVQAKKDEGTELAPDLSAEEMARLVAQPETWPKEVVLTQALQIKVKSGSPEMQILEAKEGTKVKVKTIGPDYVEILLGDVTTRLPVGLTDLAARVASAKQDRLEDLQRIAKENERLEPELLAAEEVRRARAGEVAKIGKLVAARPILVKFVHPGLPLSREDLDAIKSNLDKEPWKTGYAALAADGHSQLSYKMQGPFEHISRNPNVNLNPWRNDMQAVWNLARMWIFTGNEDYAKKARSILLAWAKTQKSFDGIESNLDLGDYAYRFGGGADILRGTWPGWSTSDTEAVKDLFGKVYWPASGAGNFALGPANKGMLSLAAGAAIACFNDDQEKFDHVLHMFRTSASSALPNTLSTGEIGETGRDQGHAYGQWVSMAFLAEVFWKQGVDVYSELDDRLLAIGEYYSRYNLALDTPFIPIGTTDALYLQNTSSPWPHGLMGMNILTGAYVVRKGMDAPYLDIRRGQLTEDMDSFVFRKVVDTSMATQPPAFAFPPASSATTGLTDLDVGEASPSGSSSYAKGVWTLRGAGSEIWTHEKDSFHFAYRQVTGDCTIIARVNSVEETAPNARAGVMIRQSLEGNPTKAWIAITPSRNLEFFMSGWTQLRGGANWEKRSRGLPSFPYWVKLQRIGKVIAVYTSPDGTSWGTAGEGYFDKLEDRMYLGLAVCSQKSGTLNTSTFTDVKISGGDGGEAPHVPEAPLAILASPGFKRVPLRWAESFGATDYKVKRATDASGPYETVAKVSGTRYIDEKVSNHQSYFYVVSAVNSAGESPDSPVEKVTPGERIASAPPSP